MAGDDTNLFYSHENIKTVFHIVNSELKLVSEWFLVNKLSLKCKEKYVLFHKVTMYDSDPLQLPAMTFYNIEIKRVNSVKFHLIWGYLFSTYISFDQIFKLLALYASLHIPDDPLHSPSCVRT